MSILIRSRTNHECEDHFELTSHDKLFACYGCKMKGFGQRYECKLCGHGLHRECMFPITTVSHEFFAGSTFTFRDEPFTRLLGHNKKSNRNNNEYSKSCDACGKDVCGSSYHCETDNLDLHPCCLSLDKKLLVDDMVFDLRPRTRSKCWFCKKRKISGGERDVPGWAYVSACDKYHFHVYCMLEMVHCAWMKNGEMGLEMVKLRRSRGSSGKGAIIATIKSVLKIILAALLGDPTALISSVLVEFVSRGLE